VQLIFLQADEAILMMSLNIKRRFGCWLLGLYVIAQLAGVVPLVSVHLQHVVAGEQDIAADGADTGAAAHVHHHHVHQSSGHHDHGAADPSDQCCTLHHHLAGVLPYAAGASGRDLVVAAIVSPLPATFVPSDPGLPERPPKLPSTI
jgi:hypothetical protein